MGLWDTIKGWLNIGGVKVLLWKYKEPLSRSDPVISGAVLLKSKSPKTVLSLEVRVVEEYTTGKAEERVTDTLVLGSFHASALGYPLELQAGEDKEEPFSFSVAFPERMQDAGGVVGTFGKVSAFMSQDQAVYYLIAEASVKGVSFCPSHKVKLKIAK